MFEVYASYAIESKIPTISQVDAKAVFDTEEARDAAIAAFPKWVKVKPSFLYTQDGTYPIAVMRVLMIPTKGNEANETGAKRIRRFLEVAGEVEFKTPYRNSVETLDTMLSLI